MYHDVASREVVGAGGGPERFSVSRTAFEEMLDTIAELGHAGCSLESALRMDGRSRVAITFDDGTMGQFEQAAPALRERGMTATFFVTTEWVGTEGFMGWDELRQMVEWGMSVQSHTRSHPHLAELDADAVRAELLDSKAELDDRLGQKTDQIALPHGNAPRRRLRRLLAECGYDVVANSRWGVNEEALRGSPKWVRRCTAPSAAGAELRRRIVTGDRRLAARRVPREAALNAVRAALGPSRYVRWRRRFLDAVDGERRTEGYS